MYRQCNVAGCSREVGTRYSVYCTKHAEALRSHGHPEQVGIRQTDLKPHLALIKELRERHKGKSAWVKIEDQWKAALSVVEGVVAKAMAGFPMNKHKAEAAREIRKIGIHVRPQRVVDTVLAMYLLQELEGRRFRSDDAFRFQLVRRVRGLTRANSRTWTKDGGKPKAAYSKLKPRTTLAMAYFITDALGVAGITVAQLQKADWERERQERLAYYESLRELV